MKNFHYRFNELSKSSDNLRFASWVSRHFIFLEENLVLWPFLLYFIAYRLILFGINSHIFHRFLEATLSSFKIFATQVKLGLKLEHKAALSKKTIIRKEQLFELCHILYHFSMVLVFFNLFLLLRKILTKEVLAVEHAQLDVLHVHEEYLPQPAKHDDFMLLVCARKAHLFV